MLDTNDSNERAGARHKISTNAVFDETSTASNDDTGPHTTTVDAGTRQSDVSKHMAVSKVLAQRHRDSTTGLAAASTSS